MLIKKKVMHSVIPV